MRAFVDSMLTRWTPLLVHDGFTTFKALAMGIGSATVGERFERLGEPVITILLDTSRDVFFICTPNRGVLRGMPYLSAAMKSGMPRISRISHV